MNNLVVLPMVIPLLIGVILVFFPKNIFLQRALTFISMIAILIISIILLITIQAEGIITIDFGGWEAPFGISFVADSFATLLVLTTSLISSIIIIFAFQTIGEKREQLYFYAFVNFLIAGVNGSFLTGDLFNLFVTFEVMLLASYALITLGGNRTQLQESIKYVAINVFASSLFLIGIAYLYGSIGTLNMAHISERVAEVGQTPILTVISLIFLLVFSLKSGLLLYQWLPGSYSVPPVAIAALFGALLTKVGIYALYRMFTLIFYHEPQITHSVIAVMAILTIIGGSIGAVAFRDVKQVVTYNVVIAVGFILAGLAIFNLESITGGIYYLLHDMIVKALLFLLAGTIIYLTKTSRVDAMSGLIRNYPALGWFFFITVISLTGIPPLSGFLGKVLIGQGALEAGTYVLLTFVFLSSMAVLYSLMRIFMGTFWGETIISEEEQIPMKPLLIIPSGLLIVLTFALGFAPEFIAPYVTDAANVLMEPQIYIDAVLDNN